MNNLEKALALANLGIAVFPFRILASGEKVPVLSREAGGRGHLDATTDEAQIREWWSKWPDALIGVAAGPSGLICADVDEKHGVSGSTSLNEAWLDLPKTWEQETPTGGRHYVYEAPEGVRLAPAKNYDGVVGLDIRAGSSWFGFYSDDLPESRDEFSPAPEWLCRPAEDRVGGAFEGGLDEWLESLQEPDAEPNDRVLDAILAIPEGEFGHVELVELQYRLVRLGAEGCPGVLHALNLLREAWLRPPYNTDEYRYEYDLALDGAIRKAGALEERIASLPDYADSLAAVTDTDGPNLALDLFVGAPKDRAHYFKTIRALVPVTDDDAVLATLVWNAPTTKTVAREFGIDYLFQKIEEERAAWDAAIRERAGVPEGNPPGQEVATPFREPSSSVDDRTSLLTDSERAIIAAHPGFIDEYLAWVDTEFTHWNENYHRACAWQVLSAAFGGTLFVAKEGDNLPLNLYTMNLGLTGTGKSDAMKTQRRVFKFLRPEEEGVWLFSGESSPQMLQEMLIDRNRQAALLSEDEAGGFYSELSRPGGHMAKMETLLNRLFDGYVDPVAKRVSKEIAGRSAVVSFSLQFFGTPSLTMAHLNDRMVASGHLARMLWTVDLSESKGEEDFEFRLSTSREAIDEHDPVALALASRLREMKAKFLNPTPVGGTPAALARLAEAARVIHDRLQAEGENWEMLRSPYRRFRDSLLKCVALHALADGRGHFNELDVLHVLAQAEIWLHGLVTATRMLAGSAFSREVDEIGLFVKEKGLVTEAQVYRKFQRWEYRREFLPRWEAAQARGLIRHRNVEGKTKWEWVE